jgi:Big-like domain-containing protein
VKLKKGTYYRVGINSFDYFNFESRAGVSAQPTAIAFVTKGADEATKQRLRIPKIVSFKPQNGATDVDPATKTLAVTFDMPMGEGMTWLGGGGKMPKTPKGTTATWSKDGKTCTLPVELEPEHDYGMALNAGQNISRWNNFQSKWGIPLEPVGYEFRTRSAAKR